MEKDEGTWPVNTMASDCEKIVVPVWGDQVAPRFDLTAEVLVFRIEEGLLKEERLFVLPQASNEELCQFILKEGATALICGGIEEEYLRYLEWKKVIVYENVIGNVRKALEAFMTGNLKPGDILIGR